ncbi:MAG: hypothetical protein MHM6MM_008469 [Cercozoa sp. M6MM]
MPPLVRRLAHQARFSVATNPECEVVLSPMQRVFLTAGAAAVGLMNTWRGDMIAALGETTGECQLQTLRDRMAATADGRKLLRDKPRINTRTLDLESMRHLPENSLGRRFVEFFETEGLSLDTRTPVRFIADADLAYVMARYREVHDIWHVLFDAPPSVLGELAQKHFEWQHTGLPMTAIAATVGPVRLTATERRLLNEQAIPWAERTARECECLLSVPFEQRLGEDIDALREQLRITPLPDEIRLHRQAE